MTHLQTPSSSKALQAERSYVGALINGDARLQEDGINQRDFADAFCASVFAACAKLDAQGMRPDYVTLCTAHPEFDTAAVDRLCAEAAVDASIVHQHAAVLRDATARRDVGEICRHALNALGDQAVPMEDTLAKARKALDDVDRRVASGEAISGTDAITSLYAWMTSESPEKPISTGLPPLDAYLGGGFTGGRLIVIGARPGVGKSALLSFIAERALEEGLRVLYVSLEMSDQEVVTRMLAQAGGVPCSRIQGRSLTEEDYEAFAMSCGAFTTENLMISTGAGTPAQIRRAALRMRAAGGLDLICVDYLQLMHADCACANRVEEVSEISRRLKRLAMEMGCPVLAAAQVNRASVYGGERAPRLSELRESGSIEQDADVVLLLHSTREEIASRGMRPVALAIAKNRHGGCAHMGLGFSGESMRFVPVKH